MSPQLRTQSSSRDGEIEFLYWVLEFAQTHSQIIQAHPNILRRAMLVADQCESFIEKKLLFALWMQPFGDFPVPNQLFREDDWREMLPKHVFSAWIMPQCVTGNLPYRLDFAITFPWDRKFIGFGIECDGHDFHEKTKEQISRDKSREREILRAGYPILRFSGSEIWRNSQKCAEECAEFAKTLMAKRLGTLS